MAITVILRQWDCLIRDQCDPAYICELGGKEIKRWRRIIGGT